jgi:hypothetical protein
MHLSSVIHRRITQVARAPGANEPSQVRVIHGFLSFNDSYGQLIHAYFRHNRSKSGSSITVSRATSMT